LTRFRKRSKQLSGNTWRVFVLKGPVCGCHMAKGRERLGWIGLSDKLGNGFLPHKSYHFKYLPLFNTNFFLISRTQRHRMSIILGQME
jgi:hypothetical protein